MTAAEWDDLREQLLTMETANSLVVLASLRGLANAIGMLMDHIDDAGND